MWEDPIVAEVHRIREMLAVQYNFDIEAMFADMQKRQVALGSRLVRQKRNGEPAAEATNANREAFLRFLEKVPDKAPDDWDRLPE